MNLLNIRLLRRHRLLLLSLGFCFATPLFAQSPTHAPDNDPFVYLDYPKLVQKRNRVRQKDAAAMADYQTLIEDADHAMNVNLVTVMDKKRVAPSGDKHDYLSLAPYWWPDPDQPDGLPWIRHDGKVNPETRGEYSDVSSARRLFDQMESLALGYFYSQDPQYRQRAIQWLDAWFVDPETRMNPNLDYAQGVPGRSAGRCYGIIEWIGVGKLITAVQLLQASDALPQETQDGIVRWFDEYSQWLQSSVNGRLERQTTNNHGTWYDVQLTGILLFLGKTEEARDVLAGVKEQRIAIQIQPDGSQPRELERTKSLSYSTMNLKAFTQLAVLGRKLGVDLWNYETPDGRSIPKAFAFLAPYVSGEKPWPHPQLGSIRGALRGLRSHFESTIEIFELPDP